MSRSFLTFFLTGASETFKDLINQEVLQFNWKYYRRIDIVAHT